MALLGQYKRLDDDSIIENAYYVISSHCVYNTFNGHYATVMMSVYKNKLAKMNKKPALENIFFDPVVKFSNSNEEGIINNKIMIDYTENKSEKQQIYEYIKTLPGALNFEDDL